MTKVAIITDQHYGFRNDNQIYYEYFNKFYTNIFFPTIDKYKIDTIIHLGDIVDRRKYINFLTANKLHEHFIKPIIDRNIDFHITLGNHDVSYKNTNEINVMKELYGTSAYPFKIYDKPAEVNIHGLDILMLPWICEETQELTLSMLKNTKAHVAMGHLELEGFELYRGQINEHGMDSNLLNKFDLVFSGHYHHKSTVGNISYLGAAHELIWSDFDDPRGFHIFDTETRELEFIQNPYKLFRKIYYDDLNKTKEDILNFDESIYEKTYVKVIVRNKNNPYFFDLFLNKLEAVNPNAIQTLEDVLNIENIDDEIIDEAEDTITILKKYISSFDDKISKKQLENFIQSLYNEALTIEG
jgi:predicted phosphodiesterase